MKKRITAFGLKNESKTMQREVVDKMLTLATSGFGLVAALAWNELIKEIVSQYIKPFVGGSSGIISLGIYAIIITILAVVVTYNLSRLAKRI